MKRIRIIFPVPVTLPDGWSDALRGLCAMLPCRSDVSAHDSLANCTRVIISCDDDIEIPIAWERALLGLVDMICSHYESGNPTRAMWVSGGGSEDQIILEISCSEEKDHHGCNPDNPDGERLRKEASEQLVKFLPPKPIGVSRGPDACDSCGCGSSAGLGVCSCGARVCPNCYANDGWFSGAPDAVRYCKQCDPTSGSIPKEVDIHDGR
jgi:hypothetical protein